MNVSNFQTSVILLLLHMRQNVSSVRGWWWFLSWIAVFALMSNRLGKTRPLVTGTHLGSGSRHQKWYCSSLKAVSATAVDIFLYILYCPLQGVTYSDIQQEMQTPQVRSLLTDIWLTSW